MELHLTATGCHLPYGITCHPTQVNMPRLTPARQADTQYTYPGGIEGWVDLSVRLQLSRVSVSRVLAVWNVSNCRVVMLKSDMYAVLSPLLLHKSGTTIHLLLSESHRHLTPSNVTSKLTTLPRGNSHHLATTLHFLTFHYTLHYIMMMMVFTMVHKNRTLHYINRR